jgi:RNA polymerase subunit RPABC4/transcription elongation factor Spt4
MLTMTHCGACHALVNPSWNKCFVCGRQVNETPPVAP